MEPENITTILDEPCPLCRGKMYAYWHTPCSDQPELGRWYIDHNGDTNCPGLQTVTGDSEDEIKQNWKDIVRRAHYVMQ